MGNSQFAISGVVGAYLCLALASSAMADTAEISLVQWVEGPHTELVEASEKDVRDYEVGLGPLQKFRGNWKFEKSRRFTGELSRNTWQVVDGFTSEEKMLELVAELEERGDAVLLFSCDGRRCGHGSQWANRVFGQRILYGRADMQRYRVYVLGDEAAPRAVILIYASARSSDRQYLHTELLAVKDTEPASNSTP